MASLEILIELFEIGLRRWSPRPWAQAAPPTSGSVSRTERELGLRLPADFVRLAAECPSYGAWFGSIGDDFDQPGHITSRNALYHDARQLHDGADGPILPPHLVMLDHGHDRRCDCWDATVTTAVGEHPIVSVSLGDDPPELTGTPCASFRSYLERLVPRYALSAPERSQRRRARELVRELGLPPSRNGS